MDLRFQRNAVASFVSVSILAKVCYMDLRSFHVSSMQFLRVALSGTIMQDNDTNQLYWNAAVSGNTDFLLNFVWQLTNSGWYMFGLNQVKFYVRNMFANFMAVSCDLVYTLHHRCDCRAYIEWLLDYPTVATIEAVSVCRRFAIVDLNLGSQPVFVPLRLVLRHISPFTLAQPLTKMSTRSRKVMFLGSRAPVV
jgi:hypothetical protein